ncbi:MAG: hypothetical protein HEQ10_23095 [Dolichospermum sp. DEX182a]|nr:hypothetical protein [Dolichospermum sp. DEX182a]
MEICDKKITELNWCMAVVPHKVTIEGKTYMARLPDVYSNIKSIVGVEKAPENDNTNYAGRLQVSEAVMDGKIVRIILRLKNKKQVSVICESSKFASAMGALLSKKIGEEDIKTARVARRMRLS